MTLPDPKRAIRASFDLAAAQYDSVAEVQRRIAHALANMLPGAVSGPILDAGCGTGFGANLLHKHLPDQPIITLDHALAMSLRSGYQAVCGDIEALPLASASLGLYWSSLAWQWTDPAQAAREAARALRPGGYLRLASLGPATLHELRAAFAHADSYRHVRNFLTGSDYAHALYAAGLREIHISQAEETVYAADLASALRSIRTLGASILDAPRRPGLLGKAAWQRAAEHYERHRTRQGLPLTYDALYLCARKPIEQTP